MSDVNKNQFSPTNNSTSFNNLSTTINAAATDDCVIPSLRFPQKLWRIVNECQNGAIKWGNDGLSIMINYKTFQDQYLGSDASVFKTSNIASFIRQLNLYGFRKVTSHNRELYAAGINIVHHHQDMHEFVHEYFRAGRLDLLSRVCRKTALKKNIQQTNKPIVNKLNISSFSPSSSSSSSETKDNQMTGMTRLQMCQIALTKALEQATKEYKKDKISNLQLLKESSPQDTLKPKFKTETLESNIQIIFQDFSQVQTEQNIPVIDASNVENFIDYQDKIQWEEVFTLPVDNSVAPPF